MESSSYPRKKYYRQRAHTNPIADHCFDYPIKPSEIDWKKYYPDFDEINQVEFLDVGCGYGGLLTTLSQVYPDTLSLGFEIRVKVSDFIQDRIEALRKECPNQYRNIACIRTNAMKYLPNYFKKGQLVKIFFLFPDPHFKKQKHKWRIINSSLLAEYAYILRVGGRVYFVTDVEELFHWMVEHFEDYPLFEPLTKQEIEEDIIVDKLFDCTEEGKKVSRMNGKKFLSVFKRIQDPFMSELS